LFQDILFDAQRREALAAYEALQALSDSPQGDDLATQTLNLIDALLAHITEATERQQKSDTDVATLTDALTASQEHWAETKDELDTAEDLLEHANSRIHALKQEVTSLTAFRPF
jgi:peptidoglycan hydrolase CwlO-like protein